MQKKRDIVLLVDDEIIVLQSTQRLLERKGYKVMAATNGHHALEILHDNIDHIGAILLDLSMPVMDGEETLENLLAIDPDAKVILFSGYAATKDMAPLFEKGALDHIQKPFDIKELVAKIDAVMVR